MGQYSFKNEEKELDKGENAFLEYCTYNLQVFKRNSFNTFISKISQGKEKNFDLFSIFVGNNGNEISKFVSNHFHLKLLDNIDKNNFNIKNSIKETFLQMNQLMNELESKKEIAQLRQLNIEKENEKMKKIIDENDNKIEKPNDKDEDEEILNYTGCSASLILIDEKNKKLYFGNLGNTEVIICGEKKESIILSSQHRPTDESEKNRIESENGLIINDKLYGILNTTRGFGNFAFIKSNEFSQLSNKIFSDEPDIFEYDLKEGDKYIFMGTESIIECINKKEFQGIIKNGIKETLETILEDNISSDFYNNDSEFGFDNITCTLIQIKNEKKEEDNK